MSLNSRLKGLQGPVSRVIKKKKKKDVKKKKKKFDSGPASRRSTGLRSSPSSAHLAPSSDEQMSHFGADIPQGP